MLTDREVKNAEPRLKVYKLYDGNGLLLRVKPNGSKSWEFKYRVNGEGKRVEKLLSLGTYNEVGLKEARQKCAEARRMCSASLDPSTERKRQKQLAKFNAENTFSSIAEEWIQKVSAKWTPRYTGKLRRRMELHLLAQLGKRPIGDISTLDLLEALRRPEAAGKVETAHRVLQVARSIFQYAVLTQRIKYNPANDLRGVLQSYQEAHYPTIGHNHLPGFLSDLENVETTTLNRLAVKLLMLTMVRQGEMRRARWMDISTDSCEWRIPAEFTKMRQEHLVPLSSQAIQILTDLRHISGDTIYVFPSQNKQKHPIMSENTINKLIHKMGYKGKLVGHGFRSMASTILNEQGFRADVIERQLAHMPRDKVRAAYNRAQYLPERKEMMQWWGDYTSLHEDFGFGCYAVACRFDVSTIDTLSRLICAAKILKLLPKNSTIQRLTCGPATG